MKKERPYDGRPLRSFYILSLTATVTLGKRCDFEGRVTLSPSRYTGDDGFTYFRADRFYPTRLISNVSQRPPASARTPVFALTGLYLNDVAMLIGGDVDMGEFTNESTITYRLPKMVPGDECRMTGHYTGWVDNSPADIGKKWNVYLSLRGDGELDGHCGGPSCQADGTHGKQCQLPYPLKRDSYTVSPVADSKESKP